MVPVIDKSKELPSSGVFATKEIYFSNHSHHSSIACRPDTSDTCQHHFVEKCLEHTVLGQTHAPNQAIMDHLSTMIPSHKTTIPFTWGEVPL